MNAGLWTIASGATAALARLDAASQNLANVNTAGYKAERPVFRLEKPEETPGETPDRTLSRLGGPVVELERRRDFSPGPIHNTGNPLDVAVQGDGFFTVNTPNGARYTRAGQFQLDAQGYLVTSDGHRVQGDGGDIQITRGTPEVAADGTVTADGRPIGRLAMVSFGTEPQLEPEGGNLYAPATPRVLPTPLDAKDVSLVQGSIEAANVDAVQGLVELVDVSRGYEQYMKALERFDQITQRSVNEVGRI